MGHSAASFVIIYVDDWNLYAEKTALKSILKICCTSPGLNFFFQKLGLELQTDEYIFNVNFSSFLLVFVGSKNIVN